MTDAPTPDHRLDRADELVHQDWDRDREPVLTVDDGAVVEFACRDATNGRCTSAPLRQTCARSSSAATR